MNLKFEKVMFMIHDIKSLESDLCILFSRTLTVYISFTKSDYPHQFNFCLFHSYCVMWNI